MSVPSSLALVSVVCYWSPEEGTGCWGRTLNVEFPDKSFHLTSLGLIFVTIKLVKGQPGPLVGEVAERMRDKACVLCLEASEMGVIAHFGPLLGLLVGWADGLPCPEATPCD